MSRVIGLSISRVIGFQNTIETTTTASGQERARLAMKFSVSLVANTAPFYRGRYACRLTVCIHSRSSDAPARTYRIVMAGELWFISLWAMCSGTPQRSRFVAAV